jgi:hypothetical protein
MQIGHWQINDLKSGTEKQPFPFYNEIYYLEISCVILPIKYFPSPPGI